MRDLSRALLREIQLESLSRVASPTVLDALDDLMTSFGHPWCLIGGIAVVAHGYNRTTDDIDLMVACSREEFGKLRLLANGSGFKAPTSYTGTIQRMTYQGTQIEVLLATDPLRVRACQDAVVTSILSKSLPIISLRDIIVQKIKAQEENPERKNRDWGDINGLLGTLETEEIDSVVAQVTPDVSDRSAHTLAAYASLVRER